MGASKSVGSRAGIRSAEVRCPNLLPAAASSSGCLSRSRNVFASALPAVAVVGAITSEDPPRAFITSEEHGRPSTARARHGSDSQIVGTQWHSSLKAPPTGESILPAGDAARGRLQRNRYVRSEEKLYPMGPQRNYASAALSRPYCGREEIVGVASFRSTHVPPP